MTSLAQAGANSEVLERGRDRKGMARRTAMIVILSVPTNSGSSEYFGIPDMGCQVMRPVLRPGAAAAETGGKARLLPYLRRRQNRERLLADEDKNER